MRNFQPRNGPVDILDQHRPYDLEMYFFEYSEMCYLIYGRGLGTDNGFPKE